MVGGHGVGRNHFSDIVLALSTANTPNELAGSAQIRGMPPIETNSIEILKNESMDSIFRAASEATEEAILNSMVASREGRTGFQGLRLEGLPVGKVKELLGRHLVVV
jgi:D-aminopeptidase